MKTVYDQLVDRKAALRACLLMFDKARRQGNLPVYQQTFVEMHELVDSLPSLAVPEKKQKQSA